VGFTFIQPFIEKKFGVHDTCGVHNLHGMPGLIGGFTAIIASLFADSNLYQFGQLTDIFPARDIRSAGSQASFQLAFMGITLGIALSSGALTGFLLRIFYRPTTYFLDNEYWEVPNLETPYYFDHRGEIIRDLNNDEWKHENIAKEERVAQNRMESLEAKISQLEKRMKEMDYQSKQNESLGGTSTNSLLQQLTQKVDTLLTK